jgi:translation initiation factor 2 subunit 2
MDNYLKLLDNVISKININEDKKKILIPILSKQNKIIIWDNFDNTCVIINRNKDKVFLETELNVVTSINSKNQLLIRGIYNIKQIQSILKSFIKEFVICRSCNRINTELTKNNRLLSITCNDCKSQYYITINDTGFRAENRRDRINKKLI